MVADELVDAQKRKLAGESGDAETAPKRMASDAPALMEVDAEGMRYEDFSPELLRIYYDKLFPFLGMFRWLSYRNDPNSSHGSVEKDFFLRREFTLVLAGDVYCRYQSFKNADEYRQKVIQQQPQRMEIGAVYSHPPKNHNTVIKDAYKPVERELVFDIDMDDYDGIRTCCTGSKLCIKCWTFMKAAIKTLERALREDFGFSHIMFVFSGRRGVHCWVCDKAARRLTNEQRSAVAEYLNLVTPGANKSRAELKLNGCEELHPSIEEAYKICEYYFKEDPKGVLRAQDILRKGPHLSNILQTMPADERSDIEQYLTSHPAATSYDIWLQFERLAAKRSSQATSFKSRAEAKVNLKDVVIQFTYPRLDINVSKQMNHLLKSPFVAHPKTGRVCVPIDPAKLDAFDPFEVPTIGRLAEELNKTSDARQTSLSSYLSFFETGFLQPLEREAVNELNKGPGALEW